MNTEDHNYKKNLKLHIPRMTAVICSGLLVFSGVGEMGVLTAYAANTDESEKLLEPMKDQSAKKQARLEETERVGAEQEENSNSLLSLLRTYTDNEKKPEEKYDYQLKDFAENETLKEFVYESSPGWEQNLPRESSGAVLSGSEREKSKKRMQKLKKKVKKQLEEADGTWSVYVKDLQNEVSFSINNEEMYAASLIKLFVMENCFANYDEIVANCNEIITKYKINIADAEGEVKASASQDLTEKNAGEEYIDTLLKAMIEVSDNESYNELVKLQNADRDFGEGAEAINKYLETRGYTDTGLYHSLHPAPSAQEWISMEQNHTSVEDCGLLLERIYDGECVSEEASADMLELLLKQQVVQKIPAGLPDDESVVCANKTGETDTDHHDAAIVFGPQTDYVLCIMSSEWIDGQLAVETIQEISGIVYKALNDSDYPV